MCRCCRLWRGININWLNPVSRLVEVRFIRDINDIAVLIKLYENVFSVINPDGSAGVPVRFDPVGFTSVTAGTGWLPVSAAPD